MALTDNSLWWPAIATFMIGVLLFPLSLQSVVDEYSCPRPGCQCATLPNDINKAQLACKVDTLDNYTNFNVVQTKYTAWLTVSCNYRLVEGFIQNYALSHLSELEELLIYNCLLSQIQPFAFYNLTSLKILKVENGWDTQVHFSPGVFNSKHMPNLEMLSLSLLTVRKFPPAVFCELDKLKTLNLSYTYVTDFESAGLVNECVGRTNCTACLQNLTTLDMRGNYLKSINLPLSTLISPLLESIHFQENKITQVLENTLENLPNLQMVDLTSNQLNNLPKGFFQNKSQLKIVKLGHNAITSLPRNLFVDCPNIEEIHLQNNQLTNLSDSDFKLRAESFQNLSSLTELLLQGNIISSIDGNAFSGMPNMNTLNMNHNKFIRNVSKSIFQGLNRLKNLQIADCGLTTIHKHAFQDLTSLTTLNISFNDLQTIPSAIRNLNFLQFLDVKDNQISSVAEDSLQGLYQLLGISLKKNKIRSLPPDVFKRTPKIQLINLEKNQLQILETRLFKELQYLNFIKLDHNQLTDIDLLFPFVRNLIGLYISNNKITAIKANMFPASLVFVDLSHNQIATIEDYSFASLSRLKVVYLQHNRLEVVSLQSIKVAKQSQRRPQFKLSGNILNCSCDVKWMREKTTLSYWPIISDMNSIYCWTVPERNLKSIAKVNMERFLCEFKRKCIQLNCNCCYQEDCQCRYICPRGCNCYNDYAWNNLYIYCDNRGLEEVPASIPFRAGYIYLQNNNISVLKKGSFTGLTKVKELWLNNSRIVNIEPGSFEGQRDLKILHLDQNNISRLTKSMFSGLHSLEALYLNDNQIKSINTDSFLGIKYLRTLYLNNNQLQVLSFDMLRPHYYMEQLQLAGNPWICNCSMGPDLQRYVTAKAATIPDANDVACDTFDDPKYPEDSDQLNVNYTIPKLLIHNFDYCYNNFTNVTNYVNRQVSVLNTAHITALSILAAVFVITLITVAVGYIFREKIKLWLFTRFGWRVLGRLDEDPKRVYDGFIAYSSKDDMFVVQTLCPCLENGSPSYKLCVHYRDFPVGACIAETIIEAVESSKRTILLLSRNFLQSEWCRYEFKTAHHQVLKDKAKRLIVILMEDIPLEDLDPDLRLYLKTNTYLKWGDQWFWEKLKYALPDKTPKKRKSKSVPESESTRESGDTLDLEAIPSTKL